MARPYRGSGRRSHSKKPKGGVVPKFPEGVGNAVMVNGYSAEWLGKGFDWVYPNEITGRKGNTESGSIVQIVAKDGRCLGSGVSSAGKVAVRRFRRDPGPVDQALISERVRRAKARRRFDEELDRVVRHSARRVVGRHGHGNGLQHERGRPRPIVNRPIDFRRRRDHA